MNTVRLIKTLKNPAEPERDFEDRLLKSIHEKALEINHEDVNNKNQEPINKRKLWLSSLLSAAALLIIVILAFNLIPFQPRDTTIVYAIEKAYEEVKAYHGNLEITTINEEMEITLQSELEIWSDREGNYYVELVSGGIPGLITANNGESKWQINPDESKSWQIVHSLEEVTEILGFVPQSLNSKPEGFELKSITIHQDTKSSRLSYESTTSQDILLIHEKQKANEWIVDSMSIIGKVNEHPSEITLISEKNAGFPSKTGIYTGYTDIISVRWQEDDSEYTIISNLSLETIKEFIEKHMGKTALLPEKEEFAPGESSLAQVFASLELYPEGITGDYPIDYKQIHIIVNDGLRAIAQIGGDITTIDKVYLEKVVRQDETGIWTVVGYDPK